MVSLRPMNSVRIFLMILLLATLSTITGIAQVTDSSAAGASVSLKQKEANLAILPDSQAVKQESIIIPKKAAMYSALVPGLGQLYNRQYWKLPIVYGLCGAAVYFFIDNSKNYNALRKEYAGRVSLSKSFVRDERYSQYEIPQIETLRDYYKRNLDLTGLLTGVGYALQVMDALVSGHLKGFDISPDISMRMRPVAMPMGGLGVGVVVAFK